LSIVNGIPLGGQSAVALTNFGVVANYVIAQVLIPLIKSEVAMLNFNPEKVKGASLRLSRLGSKF
jgi:hypothetical protein